jgi:hypothetical protein
MPINRLIPFIIVVFFLTASCFGQWAESYYDCICYNGNRNECLKKVDQDYPEFRREFTENTSNKEDSTTWLSQMRAAQIILEQRYQVRSHEEGSCLQTAIGVIKSALGFSLKEKQLSLPNSVPFLKSLYTLSKEAYQWAQENCFNQANGQFIPLSITLPNPLLCRSHD